MNTGHLSDSQLLKDIKTAVKNEQICTLLVLEHLQEIAKRRLYCDLHCSSLFEYCVQELGYSPAQAYRRIDALKITERHPEIKKELSSGQLSLTNINLCSTLFKDAGIKNPRQEKDILDQVKGKSKR